MVEPGQVGNQAALRSPALRGGFLFSFFLKFVTLFSELI